MNSISTFGFSLKWKAFGSRVSSDAEAMYKLSKSKLGVFRPGVAGGAIMAGAGISQLYKAKRHIDQLCN